MKSRSCILGIAVSLVTVMTIATDLTAQNQVRYTVTDLGTLGGSFSQAYGVNNNGSVVGFATLPGDTALHAFLWRKGVMTDLGSLAPTDTLPYSVAYSINDNDEIVGFSETSTADPRGENICGNSLVCLPVLWSGGSITALPTLGGNNGQASNINNRGQVVGVAENSQQDLTCAPPQVLVIKPTIWEEGQPSALPSDPLLEGIIGGGPGPAGNNDKGQVVGNTVTCTFSSVRAVLWDNGIAIDMGTLAGLDLAPVSINNSGQATGTAFDPVANLNRGFLWQDGVASDLGSLPGYPQVHGNSINDGGRLAGQMCDVNQTFCTTFLWRDGFMTDLNTVVAAGSLYMWDPAGINSSGEIVGLGIDFAAGQAHAFLAIPCDGMHANQEACNGKSTAAAPAGASHVLDIVLPKNVRNLLNRKVRSHFHIPSAF